MRDQDAWTLYWQGNNPESCMTLLSSEDEPYIDTFWKGLSDDLYDQDSIIDLATGSGSVARRLATHANRNNISFNITGVDLAAIDHRILSTYPVGIQQQLKFQGNVSLEELPFEDESFSAVVSQFGFEYADMSKSVGEACRILKSGGVLRLLLHHEKSEVLKENIKEREELTLLLSDQGVLDKLLGFFGGDNTSESLEASGKQFMRTAREPSGSAQAILKAVGQLLSTPMPATEKMSSAESFKYRVEAELSRLCQLQNAALSEQQITGLKKAMEKLGLHKVTIKPFLVGADKALLAWSLIAEKPE